MGFDEKEMRPGERKRCILFVHCLIASQGLAGTIWYGKQEWLPDSKMESATASSGKVQAKDRDQATATDMKKEIWRKIPTDSALRMPIFRGDVGQDYR